MLQCVCWIAFSAPRYIDLGELRLQPELLNESVVVCQKYLFLGFGIMITIGVGGNMSSKSFEIVKVCIQKLSL